MTPAPNTAPPRQVTEDISQNKRRGSMDRRWSIDQPATPPRTAEQPVGTGSVAMRIGERPHTTVESINEEEDARPLMLAPDSEAVLVNEGTMPDPNSDPMLRVLRKPPDLRTEEDLIVVANATKTVKFFRQMGDAALHRELCRHMTLEQVPKESVIFQQGDEGSTFYIIYTGAVKVRGAPLLAPLYCADDARTSPNCVVRRSWSRTRTSEAACWLVGQLGQAHRVRSSLMAWSFACLRMATRLVSSRCWAMACEQRRSRRRCTLSCSESRRQRTIRRSIGYTRQTCASA